MIGLIIVSNCEVSKVTVHTYSRGAFYYGSIASDAEAQPVLGESERANLDSWLRDDLDSMPGQGYAETFASRYWNLQLAILYLESVAGDELWFHRVGASRFESSLDGLLSGCYYSRGSRYRAELVVARRIIMAESVVA